MDAIITHVGMNPRASHAETRLRRRVAAAFPDLSPHFNNHARNANAVVHHDNAMRHGVVRTWLVFNVNLQNVAQSSA